MDTATLDAPAIIPEQTFVSGQDTSPSEQKGFNDIFSTPPDAPVKEPVKKVEQPKKAAEPKAKQDAPNAKETGKEAKPQEKKGKWDGLEALKKIEIAEEAPEDTTQSTDEVDNEKEPDVKAGEPTTRWKELKAVETAAKKSETIDDILKIPSLSDKAKEQLKAMKGELEGYKSNGHIPEETKQRMEWLERRFASETLDSDPGFQQEVLQPIENSWNRLGKIAQDAGLDASAGEAFQAAIMNRDEVARALAISRIISGGKVDEDGEAMPLADNVIQILTQKASAIADALHEQHWPKEIHYRRNAAEVANSIRAKDSQLTEAETKAKDEEYTKEATRLSTIIKERMPLVFEQHPDAMEAILQARPSTDLADQVFDAQSGHLVNFLSKTLNATLEKVAKMEAREKARDKAKPSFNGNGATPPKREESTQPDFNEVFGRR